MIKENNPNDGAKRSNGNNQSSSKGGKGSYRRGPNSNNNNNNNRGQNQAMNGIKGGQNAGVSIPARTTSAPPSLAEQQQQQHGRQGGPNTPQVPGAPLSSQPGMVYHPQYMYQPQYMMPRMQPGGGSPTLGPMGMMPQVGVPGDGTAAAASVIGSPSLSPNIGPMSVPQYYQRPMGMHPQQYFQGYHPQQFMPMGGVPGTPPRGPVNAAPVPEKKILEIFDPKTNRKVLPTVVKPKTPAVPVAAAAPAAAAKSENESSGVDKAADIRAQFLEAAKRKIQEGNKAAAATKPTAAAPAPTPTPAPAPVPAAKESTVAADRRAQEEEARRKLEEAKSKREKLLEDTNRKSKEEAARLQMEEMAKERERRKAEILARQEQTTTQETPGLVRTAASVAAAAPPAPASGNSIQARFGLAADATPSAFPSRGARGTSAFGDNSKNAPSAFGGRGGGNAPSVQTINPAPTQTTSTMPNVPVDRSSGKIKYTLDALLQFKTYEKCKEVPPELRPEVIDLLNIIVGPGPQPRGGRNDRHHNNNHNNDRNHGGYNNQTAFKGNRQGGGSRGGRGGYNNNNNRDNYRGGRGGHNNNNNQAPWQQHNNQQGGYQGPVEPVKRTENAWVPTKAKDEHTATIKTVKGILNKLTKEKFDKLSQKMVAIPMTSVKMLKDVMDAVFDKALGEAHFSEMYADLCKVLADHSTKSPWEFVSIVPQDGGYFWTSNMDPTDPNRLVGPYPTEDKARAEGNKATNFKRILLNKCQEEFEGSAAEEILKKVDAEEAELKAKREGLSEEEGRDIDVQILELDYQRKKVKRRMLGNINFIGELFKKEMLTARIMHECIIKLLGKPTDVPDEENIECLCKLLITIGEQLDTKEAKKWIDKYFQNLGFYSVNKNLSARHRFMAKDVIELRSNGWKKRREELKAQTLDEIKKAKEEEERQNQQNIERNRHLSRGGRGRSNRDNRGQVGGPQGGNRNVMANAVFSSTMGSGFALGSGAGRTLGGSQDVRNLGGAQSRRAPTGARPSPQGQGGMRPGGTGSMRPGGGGGSMRPGGGGGSAPRAVMRPGAGGVNARPGQGTRGGNNNRNTAAPAPSKPEMPIEKVKLRVKSALEEFVNLRDVEEVVANLKELDEQNANTTDSRHRVVRQGVEWIIEAKDETRQQMYVILPALYKEGQLKTEHFVQVLKEDFENISDVLVDAPKADQYLAVLIVALVTSKAIAVSDLAEILSKLKVADDYYCTKLAGVFLSALSKDAATKSLVSDSNLDVAGLVGGADKVPEFLEKYQLEGVFGGADSSTTDEVCTKVKNGESVNDILKWIQKNAGADVLHNKDFVSTVVCAILAHVEKSEGLLEATAEELSPELQAKEKEAVTRYSPLLKRVLFDAPEADRVAIQSYVLAGIVNMCHSEKFPNPNATVLRLFTALYECDAVAEEAFLKWRDDGSSLKSTESSNFQGALIKCSSWLQWLEKADEASDQSEEDTGAKATVG